MKKNRSTLKDYFKKGAIPTESNFADLIDSMLNQEEDAIAKLPNDPLKITAIGVDEALVNFYRIEKNEEKLSWQIKQKPSGVSGLSIGDTAASRLFIENGTGNLSIGATSVHNPQGWNKTVDILGTGHARLNVRSSGGVVTSIFSNDDWTGPRGAIGTDSNHPLSFVTNYAHRMTISADGNVGIGIYTPIAKLDIQANATRTGTHPTSINGLYVTGAFGEDRDGIEFRHSNGSYGIGFGYGTIYTNGSATDQDLGLKPRGTGKVVVRGSLQVSGGQIQMEGAQKIVFSDNDTTNNLKLQLWTGYGLGINGSTLFYAATGNHSWRDTNGANERMLLSTGADGGLTVKGTGNSSFAGNLGIGTTSPGAKVEISKTVANALGGVLRISNPSGGTGTQAALEFTTYAVGTSLPGFRIAVADNGNYSADVDFQTKNPGANANPLTTRFKITADGNIGIGTTTPRTKLDTGTGVLSGAANDYIKAQFSITGGGTVSWGGPGGRLKWTNRFIAISMEKSVSFSGGHVNIYQPTSDIPAAQVYDGLARSATADGVILNGWEALYAVHTVGGDQSAIAYQIVKYTNNINAPSNWLLVAVVNEDDKTVRLGTGVILSQNSSSSQSSQIPRGVITMWSGATNTIPGGWALCDGANGTPNLKDKFVVGAGSSYAVGATGGADTVTLTTAQMPSHNHNNGDYRYLLQRDSQGRWTSDNTDTTVGEPDILHSNDIQSAGGNQAHENRPPYYALAYIMKL